MITTNGAIEGFRPCPRKKKNAFSKGWVFISIKNASIPVRTNVLMRFRLSTLKRSTTVELHVLTSVELYAYEYKQTPLRYFQSSFSFDKFSNERPKRIEMSAFSNEKGLAWTEP